MANILSIGGSRERVMATEPPARVDILAGTFVLTRNDGTVKEADFYVRTCEAPNPDDPACGEIQSIREDDLNEQYTEVAARLYREYDGRVVYKSVVPNPFFE